MTRHNYGTQETAFLFVNYIEPILEYTEQKDLFQLTKTPEKSLRQEDIMDVLLPLKQKKQDVKKLAKRTRKLFADYDHDSIEIWENQLGAARRS